MYKNHILSKETPFSRSHQWDTCFDLNCVQIVGTCDLSILEYVHKEEYDQVP